MNDQSSEIYTILGVNSNATEREIRVAFRKAAKAHHPDAHINDPRAEARFKKLNEAYELALKNLANTSNRGEEKQSPRQEAKVERSISQRIIDTFLLDISKAKDSPQKDLGETLNAVSAVLLAKERLAKTDGMVMEAVNLRRHFPNLERVSESFQDLFDESKSKWEWEQAKQMIIECKVDEQSVLAWLEPVIDLRIQRKFQAAPKSQPRTESTTSTTAPERTQPTGPTVEEVREKARVAQEKADKDKAERRAEAKRIFDLALTVSTPQELLVTLKKFLSEQKEFSQELFPSATRDLETLEEMAQRVEDRDFYKRFWSIGIYGRQQPEEYFSKIFSEKKIGEQVLGYYRDQMVQFYENNSKTPFYVAKNFSELETFLNHDIGPKVLYSYQEYSDEKHMKVDVNITGIELAKRAQELLAIFQKHDFDWTVFFKSQTRNGDIFWPKFIEYPFYYVKGDKSRKEAKPLHSGKDMQFTVEGGVLEKEYQKLLRIRLEGGKISDMSELQVVLFVLSKAEASIFSDHKDAINPLPKDAALKILDFANSLKKGTFGIARRAFLNSDADTMTKTVQDKLKITDANIAFHIGPIVKKFITEA